VTELDDALPRNVLKMLVAEASPSHRSQAGAIPVIAIKPGISPILAHHRHCRARIQFTISVGSRRFPVPFETGIYSRVDGNFMLDGVPTAGIRGVETAGNAS
jgi:hypothetical protein